MLRGLLAAVAGVLTAAALGGPGAAQAAPGLVVGAVEDDVRASSLVEAETRMTLLRVAGFRAVRVTSFWLPGQREPSAAEREVLGNVAAAAARNGVRVFVTVMHPGSRTTPLTDEARADFAANAAALVRAVPGVRDVVVGNEPNLNRFWLPQFNPDGSSAAPAAYLQLLAQAYDALKAVSPGVRVYGGALSPRGADRPSGSRPTHSPTRFIQELGLAYRASGRTAPVMDGFALHPYTDNSSQPPATTHPSTTTIAIADYDKLVALLGQAFDGTAQRGSTLPVLYGEFGVESQIPETKAGLYTGAEPQSTRPVPEDVQADYYRQALGLAFCQPTVEAMLLFLARDERARAGWQSGVFYVDGTAKESLPAVSEALDRATGGSIARCPGLRLAVQPTFLRFGTGAAARRGELRVRLRCSFDCVYLVRVERLPTHSTKLVRRGRAEVGELVDVELPFRRLAPGTYRYTLRLVHPVNPGEPTLRQSPAFRIP
ncbi:MAG TPA: hypothetical protein VNJ53_04695 [Gaiellaceae bacterium]|nr:hypothetical protein [Gaiellaceae bacterium]